jgi:putative membrane protein
MSTEQPIPTPTPTSAPLPRPAIGDEAPPPAGEIPSAGIPGAEVAPPAQAAPSPAAAPSIKPKHTRTSGLWVAVGFFAVILLLLLIFILQNGKTVDVSYMGAHGHLPLGVALLLAAVCGVLLVVLAGAARISQLRTVARRHRRAHSQRAKAENNAAS